MTAWSYRAAYCCIVLAFSRLASAASIHCGIQGAWKSYPGLAIYMRYFVPLWLESHSWIIHLWEIFCTSAVGKSYSVYPFMWDILYPYSWKIIQHIIPLWLENHTLFIHLHEIFCTFAAGKSFFRPGDLSYEFHEYLGTFHTPQFISLEIFTYTILYGFIPLQLENDMIYHTSAVGKSYPFMRYIILSEYEFQSHSSSNYQLFILYIPKFTT